MEKPSQEQGPDTFSQAGHFAALGLVASGVDAGVDCDAAGGVALGVAVLVPGGGVGEVLEIGPGVGLFVVEVAGNGILGEPGVIETVAESVWEGASEISVGGVVGGGPVDPTGTVASVAAVSATVADAVDGGGVANVTGVAEEVGGEGDAADGATDTGIADCGSDAEGATVSGAAVGGAVCAGDEAPLVADVANIVVVRGSGKFVGDAVIIGSEDATVTGAVEIVVGSGGPGVIVDAAVWATVSLGATFTGEFGTSLPSVALFISGADVTTVPFSAPAGEDGDCVAEELFPPVSSVEFSACPNGLEVELSGNVSVSFEFPANVIFSEEAVVEGTDASPTLVEFVSLALEIPLFSVALSAIPPLVKFCAAIELPSSMVE